MELYRFVSAVQREVAASGRRILFAASSFISKLIKNVEKRRSEDSIWKTPRRVIRTSNN